jgi:aerobic carbon-monoxide dehydrogenase medium subunit
VAVFPANFEYVAPESLDEALALLAQRPDDAKVLAGGQSLIPLMKLRFAIPELVVDINRIPGLDTLAEEGDRLRIGALVRTADLERSELCRDRYPTIGAAAPLISDPVVRNLGTLVGSLCHADPQGDWGSVLLALDAELVARSTSGERTIPVTELLEGPFTTALRPDELAVEARVPAPTGRFSGTYLKLERKVGDFATVGVAIAVSTDDAGTVQRAGIGLTGVGGTNLKATDAEQSLVGHELSEDAIDQAAQIAADGCEPNSDIRGSAAYKRHIVRTYVTRGLRQALPAPVG